MERCSTVLAVAIPVWIRDRRHEGSLGRLPENVELHTIPSEGPLPAEIRNAEFIAAPTRSRPLLELLAEMPRLSVVQSAAAGTDWLAPWVPAGVTLCNARGTRDRAVAEWVLAAILAMEKRLPDFIRLQAEHDWRPEMLDELAGKRALIVGYGSIGRCTAETLGAVGVEVEGVVSKARGNLHGVEELAELLPTADIVVLLVPLTAATRGLFDERLLARMRRGALLVNAARGGVVETPALLAQLAAGRIRAVLDVTDPEPLPPGHQLWNAPGLLVTPHLAGDSPQADKRTWRLIADQIKRYARGEPLVNVVERSL